MRKKYRDEINDIKEGLMEVRQELLKFTKAHFKITNVMASGLWYTNDYDIQNTTEFALDLEKRLDLITNWLKEQGYELQPESKEPSKWVKKVDTVEANVAAAKSDHEIHKHMQKEHTITILLDMVKELLADQNRASYSTVNTWDGLCELGFAYKCGVHSQFYWADSNCPKCDMKRDYRKKK